MNRVFQIPVVAASGLIGCGEFAFERVWDLETLTRANGATYAFPIVDGDTTRTVTMTLEAQTATLESVKTYTGNRLPESYSLGPYSWSEIAPGRIFINASEVDGVGLICEGSAEAPRELACFPIDTPEIVYAFVR